MEEVELRPELAVVALLGLLDHVQVGVELVLLRPRGAIDTLQHLVLRVAAPVGAGELGELEDLELAGRGHVRAAAKVDEIALAVQRDVLARRDRGDDLGLVVLADALEEVHCLVARPHLAMHGNLALRDLAHALLDRLQVLGGEGALVREVVVEAVVDHRPDRHLGVGKELLHRVREQVGGGVADDFEAFGILVGDDGEIRVRFEAMREIDQLPVGATGDRRLGETGADRGCDLGNGHRMIEAAHGTIGERDVGHDFGLGLLALREARNVQRKSGKRGRKKSAV